MKKHRISLLLIGLHQQDCNKLMDNADPTVCGQPSDIVVICPCSSKLCLLSLYPYTSFTCFLQPCSLHQSLQVRVQRSQVMCTMVKTLGTMLLDNVSLIYCCYTHLQFSLWQFSFCLIFQKNNIRLHLHLHHHGNSFI